MSDNGGTTGGYNYIMVKRRRKKTKTTLELRGGKLRRETFFKEGGRSRTRITVGRRFAGHQEFLRKAGIRTRGGIQVKKGIPEFGEMQAQKTKKEGLERIQRKKDVKQDIEEFKRKELEQKQQPTQKDLTFGDILTGPSGRIPELQSQVVPFPFVPVASLPTPGVPSVSKAISERIAGKTTTISQKISLKPIAKLAGTISGVDIIANWFAADNIATGAKIDMGRLVNDVKFGTRTPEEALDIADGIQNAFDDADEFITISTSLNPALWPFKKFYGSGIDSLRLSMENDRLLIEQFRTQSEGGENNG